MWRKMCFYPGKRINKFQRSGSVFFVADNEKKEMGIRLKVLHKWTRE